MSSNVIKVIATVKATLGSGTLIHHDFSAFRWPACKAPQSHYEGQAYRHMAKDPDMTFTCELYHGSWSCRAPGYGIPNDYGNGSIDTRDWVSIKPVDGQDGVINVADLSDHHINMQYNDDRQIYLLRFTRAATPLLVEGFVVVGDGKAVRLQALEEEVITNSLQLVDSGAKSTMYVRVSSKGEEPTMALYNTATVCECRVLGVPVALQWNGAIEEPADGDKDELLTRVLKHAVTTIFGVDYQTVI